MSTVRPSIVPSLHVPEEPAALRAHWWNDVAGGRDWDDVLFGETGPGAWLWSRWRAVRVAGLEEKDFLQLVGGYRRELWLWLVGERTWVQCCAGLIGRVDRRLGALEQLAQAGTGGVPHGSSSARRL
jgi:hypothetical protein